MVRKVLVAADGSPSALTAARWVAGLASQVADLRVTVLYVIHLPMAVLEMGGEALVAPALPSQEDVDRAAQRVFAATRAIFDGVPVELETRAETGVPAETIASAARAGGFDLVVVGRRGMNPIAKLLMGSVSRRVLELAPCPVVVVKT